jgi:hypothetical protein
MVVCQQQIDAYFGRGHPYASSKYNNTVQNVFCTVKNNLLVHSVSIVKHTPSFRISRQEKVGFYYEANCDHTVMIIARTEQVLRLFCRLPSLNGSYLTFLLDVLHLKLSFNQF